MWNKFTNALKPKHDGDGESAMYSHTNKSAVSSASLPFPSGDDNHSPPPSPSKMARRGVFKRLSKTPKLEGMDINDWASPSPLKMPGFLPKAKSALHLNINRNDSQASLPRTSEDQLLIPPLTPTGLSGGMSGSVRSILRDKQTPTAGHSVRFFSRDAFQVASPPADTSKSETDDMSFLERLEKASFDATPVDPPPRTSSSSMRRTSPVGQAANSSNPFAVQAPQSLRNLFDYDDLPSIPRTSDSPIMDAFATVPQADDRTGLLESTPFAPRNAKGPEGEQPKSPVFFNPDSEQSRNGDRTVGMDRSKSFSGINGALNLVNKPLPSPFVEQTNQSSGNMLFNRNRSVSDSAFRTLSRTDSATSAVTPNRDSGTVSTASSSLATPSTPEQQHPDPFHANATAFYTPQTPPTERYINHSHKGSNASENSIIVLRTQLALQEEMRVQYEVDLNARDELVQKLSARLESSEKEVEKRRTALNRWRKKVAELEKIVHSLEDEVDRSRDESVNRSIMDEASGQALRLLQGRIGSLEKEKAEEVRRTLLAADENRMLKEKVEKLEERDRKLRQELESVKDQVEMLHGADDSMASINVEDAKVMVMKREQALSEVAEHHRREEFAWEEERAHLKTLVNALETDKVALEEELMRVNNDQGGKDEELDMIKAEVESQWENTEKQSIAIEQLESERNALQEELEKVDTELGEEQNRCRELVESYQRMLEENQDLEHTRKELAKELQSEQQRTSELVLSLRESEMKLADVSDGHQFATENISRLEEQIRQRDAEIAECRTQIIEREQEAEALRGKVSTFKRDHGRASDEQERALAEAERRETELTAELQELVKVKAEMGVEVGQVRERNLLLKDEMDRLRRQVHALQQESANKEVQVVALTKGKELAEEDKNNLNIALSAKQQELELMKRNMGVKGIAGATPAPATRTGIKPRDSNVFATPSGSRPPSRTSDSGRESALKSRLPDTPRTAIKMTSSTTSALGKSASARPSLSNSASAARSTMGPPAPKPRASIGTPTPSAGRTAAAALARSSSARPSSVVSPPPSSTAHRRASSAFDPKLKTRTSITSVLSEEDEKENSRPVPKATALRRTAMSPI